MLWRFWEGKCFLNYRFCASRRKRNGIRNGVADVEGSNRAAKGWVSSLVFLWCLLVLVLTKSLSKKKKKTQKEEREREERERTKKGKNN